MKAIRMGLVAMAAMSLLTTSALAQNPAGNWKGKMNFKFPEMPNATPEVKAQIEQGKAAIKAMSFNLALKADHTYTINVVGAPKGMGSADDQKDQGTWSSAGKSVTLKTTKKPKGPNDPKTQTLTLSADGKTMTLSMGASGGPVGGSIVFTKA